MSELQSQSNLRNIQTQIINGQLYCSYEQSIIPMQSEGNRVYPLNMPRTMFLAYGPMQGGGGNADIGYHSVH
jgi:hypothetical protein